MQGVRGGIRKRTDGVVADKDERMDTQGTVATPFPFCLHGYGMWEGRATAEPAASVDAFPRSHYTQLAETSSEACPQSRIVMGHARTREQISDIMRRVKSQDTTPEVAFRKALWARGVRYRLHDNGLPGKPDIVIPRGRLVVFIDGDYWHGNQWRRRGHTSLAEQFVASPEAEYWVGKISGNMRRDRKNIAQLLHEGWQAIRFWESDISMSLHECVEITVKAMEGCGQTPVVSRLPEQTVAEFFAGIGLMRLALDNAGWHTTFANDMDPLKYEIYRDNFPNCEDHFRLEDIHKLTADDIPTVALATASFPCNDLSLAGSMKGLSGEHSGAFWGFVRILDEMGSRRPPMVLLENVAGWLNSHGGKDFADSLLALNGLGYSCDAFMLNASRFVPQSRPRMFVVGLADELIDSTYVHDLKAIYASSTRPQLLADFITDHTEIRWSVRRLPSPPTRDTDLKDILEDLPGVSPEWWSKGRAEYFLSQMSEKHARIAAEMIKGSDYTYGTAFRRVRHGKSMAELRVDGTAGCLRTPRGGSGRQILFKAGKGRYQVRLLTGRECARLQGVPDSYKIEVPLNQALFGFGDAVCVPVIEWIANNYLNLAITEAMHGSPLYRWAMEA